MSQRPEMGPAGAWDFPQPDMFTLPNGLAVWLFQLPGQHVIAVDLALDLPLTAEPADREGVAMVTLHVSDEGTVEHPDGEVSALLEETGAAFSGRVTVSSTVAAIDVPSTRLGAAIDLFSGIVQRPQHAERDIQRHVALRLASIAQAQVDPQMIAARSLRSLLHDPSTRASRPTGGAATTVQSIRADCVADFHRQHWQPRGATLVLAGELPDDIRTSVEELFGGWKPADQAPEHNSPQWNRLTRQDGDRRVVHLVDRPEAVQAEIRLAGPSLDSSDPDFAALQVATTALGGAFGSRLNQLLREERGYTYGANASSTPLRREGTWTAATSVRTEVGVPALMDAMRVVQLDDPFDMAETAAVVNQLVGVAPLRYQTAGGIASQASALAGAGVDPAHLNRHFRNLLQVNCRSATDAWRRVATPEQTRLLMVGNAAVLRSELDAHGFEIHELTAD